MQINISVRQQVLHTMALRTLGAITHVATSDAIAALTFDDGPSPEYTPRVLDILEQHGVRATFFMVGDAARRYPDVVARVASNGHAIGNHSWDHSLFPSLSSRERRDQLLACAAAIAPYGARLFRPPSGRQNTRSRLDVWLLHYRTIGWSLDAKDWLPHEPISLADRLRLLVRPGSIVLLHDAIFRSSQKVPQYNRQNMLEGLRMFLERPTIRLRFVTIPELLRSGTPVSDESLM